jgi:hypothetical protein
MRVIMQMKWDGVTLEQYEKVRKSANWEGNPPKGALFHVAGFDSNGIRVTDIWESADEFNGFVQSRLMPAAIAAEIKGEPHVEIFPVHAIFNPALHSLEQLQAI